MPKSVALVVVSIPTHVCVFVTTMDHNVVQQGYTIPTLAHVIATKTPTVVHLLNLSIPSVVNVVVPMFLHHVMLANFLTFRHAVVFVPNHVHLLKF